MLHTIVVVGEIRPVADTVRWPKWLTLNDAIHPNNVWKGIEEPDASRYKGKIIDRVDGDNNNIHSIAVVFDPKPWGYQWIANRWNETDHTFEVSVLVPPDSFSKTSLFVAAQFQCPSFRIGCTRRLPCGHTQNTPKESTFRGKAYKKSRKAYSHRSFQGYNHRIAKQPKVSTQSIIQTKNQDEDIDSDSEDDEVVMVKTIKNQKENSAKIVIPTEVHEEMFNTKDLFGTGDTAAILTDESAALLTGGSAALMTFDCAALLTSESATSLESEDVRMLMSAVEQMTTQEPSPFEFHKSSLVNLYETAHLILTSPTPGKLSLTSPNEENFKRAFDEDFAEESSPHSPRTPRYVSV